MRIPRLWLAAPLVATLSSCAVDDGRSLLSRLRAAIGSETEPIAGSQARLRGTLSSSADLDVYSFTGAAGDKVYVATMTSGSTFTTDTVIDLLDRDGTTVLESDDQDGSLSDSASSIAGATLPAAGTYFIRLSSSGVRPYDLYFRRQGIPGTPEVEPNGTSGTAQPFPASGVIDGALADGADADFYSIALQAGDTLFLSLDLLPSRTGAATRARLGAGLFAGDRLFVNEPGTNDAIPSEALFVTVQSAGTYYASVDLGGAAPGSYRLSAAVFPRDQIGAVCTTYNSSDVPKTIAIGINGGTSVIGVPGSHTIADLSVSMRLEHPWPWDLEVVLTAPGGNGVPLLTNAGSPSFPDLDLTLDQSAAVPVDTFADMTGQVLQPQPRYRLSWFNGQEAGGTWRLSVLDQSTTGPGTIDRWAIRVCEPPPIPNCPTGVPPLPIVSFGFESGADGFTHSGASDDWAVGLPSRAPIYTCHQGAGCWKTNLGGTYSPLSNQDLVSPPIDLTAATAPVRLSWAMKYQLESATHDHAWIEIQDADGTNPTRLWEWQDDTMTPSVRTGPSFDVFEAAGWGVTTADVSAYAGRVVRLVFHLDSDGATQLAGLAIDDVLVTHCSPTCGNGVLDPGEECDLGIQNGQPGICCAVGCHFVAASVICRNAAMGGCDPPELCTGSSGVCPADVRAVEGATCQLNMSQCHSPTGQCRGGSCVADFYVSCDDNDPCTQDGCSPITGCGHRNICAPDAGGGGGNGSCGCTASGAWPAALLAIGVLLAWARSKRSTRGLPPARLDVT